MDGCADVTEGAKWIAGFADFVDGVRGLVQAG